MNFVPLTVPICKLKLLLQCCIKKSLLFVVFSLNCTLFQAHAEQINVYTEDRYPLQFKENGKLTGFSAEVVHRLFELTGDTANISVMPWSKAYNTTLIEKNAMLFSVARNQIPEKQFHWVGTLAREKMYFWGLKSAFSNDIDDIGLLKQYKITVLLSSEPARYLAEQGFDNLHKVTDSKANIITMYRGITDLTLETPVSIRRHAKELKLDLNKLKAVRELGALDTDLNIAFNKTSNLALVSKYRNALRKLQRSGELQTLAEKWNIVVSN